ncbi:MAG: glycosyltransferase family 4 protein [Thermoanaerobaculia bacterium]|nr:glycosyltransferase family 4 protein [Thermoanaerobaculia bacterium]
MQRRAARTDAFVSTSDYYAGAMRELLGIPAERMHVVHLGVNLEFIGTTHRTRDAGDDIVVGYMARICPEKGLHLLLEALHRIFVERPELPIRGRVAGYVGKRDADYLAALERRLDERGIADRVTVLGEVDLEGKRQLLQRADILSVPTVYREPKGLFVLEALAHGVPVVQPEHGAFPELVESTGGGLLVEPGSPEALAEGIVRLAEDDELRGRLGESGRRAVRERFDSHTMAERTAEIYRRAQEDAA